MSMCKFAVTVSLAPAFAWPARVLSSSRAALDLFMWLSYRCFTARGKERAPLFRAFGLVSQLGSIEYARPRKFREKLEGWLNLIRAMWPECPARIDDKGTCVFIGPSYGCAHTGSRPCTLQMGARWWPPPRMPKGGLVSG